MEFYPYGIGPLLASVHQFYSPASLVTTTTYIQRPFSKLIHIGIRDQLNTWTKTIRPDQDPAYKKPTISSKKGVSTIIIHKFVPHSKLFSDTEGSLIDVASFIEIRFSNPPRLRPHTQTYLLFPCP